MGRRVVAVTGASGLLGTWLRRTAPDDVEVVAVTHRTPVSGVRSVTADLRDAAATEVAIDDAAPALVIHAAMAVDRASIVDATEHVATAAAARGAGLVLISTDAVFSGDGRVVRESDEPDPVWDYGRWKAQAERTVAAVDATSAIVRLPLIVSLDPEDRAVARVRTHAESGEATRWFSDERRQPATADDIARAIWRIAARDPEDRAGPWHLVGPERLSRHEIAERVAAALGLDPRCVEPEPTPPGLVRPRDLHLASGRAADEIAWAPRAVLA